MLSCAPFALRSDTLLCYYKDTFNMCDKGETNKIHHWRSSRNFQEFKLTENSAHFVTSTTFLEKTNISYKWKSLQWKFMGEKYTMQITIRITILQFIVFFLNIFCIPHCLRADSNTQQYGFMNEYVFLFVKKFTKCLLFQTKTRFWCNLFFSNYQHIKCYFRLSFERDRKR